MRSNFLQQIINETPQEVDKRVRKWADDMKRAARYEARRGAYFKILKREDIIWSNQIRDQPKQGRYKTKERNYEQQEID